LCEISCEVFLKNTVFTSKIIDTDSQNIVNRKHKKSRYIGSKVKNLLYIGIYHLAQWVGFEQSHNNTI